MKERAGREKGREFAGGRKDLWAQPEFVGEQRKRSGTFAAARQHATPLSATKNRRTRAGQNLGFRRANILVPELPAIKEADGVRSRQQKATLSRDLGPR